MSRRMAARISVFALCIHGVVELLGPLVLMLNPGVQGALQMGGGEWQNSAENVLPISFIGAAWGISRFVAGRGIWSMRKWAIVVGIITSAITMIAAISVIPAGVVDTILSAPVLILLLYAWFGQDALSGR